MYSKVIWASTEHLSSSFHWTTSYVHTGPHSLIILLFSTLLFCLYLYTCILIYLYYVHLSTISHHCLGFALRELAWVAQRRTSWGDPPSLGSNYKLKIKCRATLGRGVTQLLRNAKTDYLIWWQLSSWYYNPICLVSGGNQYFWSDVSGCGFELLRVSEDPAINYRAGLQPTEDRTTPTKTQKGGTGNGRDTRSTVLRRTDTRQAAARPQFRTTSRRRAG